MKTLLESGKPQWPNRKAVNRRQCCAEKTLEELGATGNLCLGLHQNWICVKKWGQTKLCYLNCRSSHWVCQKRSFPFLLCWFIFFCTFWLKEKRSSMAAGSQLPFFIFRSFAALWIAVTRSEILILSSWNILRVNKQTLWSARRLLWMEGLPDGFPWTRNMMMEVACAWFSLH